jgi:hypothetical protein
MDLPMRSRLTALHLFLSVFLLGLLAGACGPSPAPEAPAPAPAPAVDSPTLDIAGLSALATRVITAEQTLAHVAFLASDEMRGRDTPSPELEISADYLADRFRELGLEPAGDDGTFLQWWPFQQLILDQDESEARARVGDWERSWVYGREYFALPGPEGGTDGSAIYAPSPASVAQGLPQEARGRILLVALPDGLGPDFGLVIQAGMQFGVSGVVMIMDEDTDEGEIHQIAGAVEGGAIQAMPFPIIGLVLHRGQEILREAGVEARGARDPPVHLENLRLAFRTVYREESHSVPNVVAKLRGSDPDLAETHVVLTAHFDHVGVGPPDERGDSIYNGADDNASGTAALLKTAAAFAALPEAPRRSIVFLAVSGEEKGLLGSQHYAGSPTVPQGSMIANLNMDMVGRNHPDTVFAIGEEFTSMGDLARAIARDHPELGLVVASDPEPEEQAFLRSDHFSFVQHGIPALMFTAWLHDDYHAPSDTPEKIDSDKLARVARLAFLFSHRVAQDPTPPTWTPEGRELLQGLGIQAGAR